MSHDEYTKEMFLMKFMVAFKAASEKKEKLKLWLCKKSWRKKFPQML